MTAKSNRTMVNSSTPLLDQMETEPEKQPADDWPPRPKALTLRGFYLVVLVLVFSTSLAILAIYLRRGRTVKTLDFYGMKAVELIQNSDRLYVWRSHAEGLLPDPLPDRTAMQDLTELPGISHLRAAFLDDRHYDWQAPENGREVAVERDWVLLRFENRTPQQHFLLAVDLRSGLIGPAEESKRTKLTERVRKAVAGYLAEIENASPKRAD